MLSIQVLCLPSCRLCISFVSGFLVHNPTGKSEVKGSSAHQLPFSLTPRNIAFFPIIYQYFHPDCSSGLARCMPTPPTTLLHQTFYCRTSLFSKIPYARVNRDLQSFIPFAGKLEQLSFLCISSCLRLNYYKRGVSRYISTWNWPSFWLPILFSLIGEAVNYFFFFLIRLFLLSCFLNLTKIVLETVVGKNSFALEHRACDIRIRVTAFYFPQVSLDTYLSSSIKREWTLEWATPRQPGPVFNHGPPDW